jgi:hypothetical protein
MEKMLINERFKSPNKEFEKVYILFNKKDYFGENSQVKKKQEEFVRFLKKGDPMATKVFKQNKENMKSSLSFIEDMVRDYNKKNHFEAFKIFSKAVNNIEMKDSKSAERSGNFIKSKIHNNSQKYSLAIYTAIRKQKFSNYKDVHKDVDELISKNEGFSSDAQRKAAFANGYEEKGKKKNESVNEWDSKSIKAYGKAFAKASVSDERHFGKKGIIIMIDDNGKKVSAIFKDKKNANKFNRNKPADIKKLLQLAKKTKYPKAIDESVPQGYNPMVEDKKQIKDLVKKVKHEKLFYDVLDTMEKKYGKRKYRIWLEKSLKGFGVNPKHYDYRTNAGAEEKLFQLGK